MKIKTHLLLYSVNGHLNQCDMIKRKILQKCSIKLKRKFF